MHVLLSLDHHCCYFNIPRETQVYFIPILSIFYFLFNPYRKAILFLFLSYIQILYQTHQNTVLMLFYLL